jgi:hypothetical protein
MVGAGTHVRVVDDDEVLGLAIAEMVERGYLPKPLSLAALRAIAGAQRRAPDPMGTIAAACVGYESLQGVQTSVKLAMVEQALALSSDNRTNAARLLGVSRQAVQQMIRDLEIRPSR